jgi:hypothetical protein
LAGSLFPEAQDFRTPLSGFDRHGFVPKAAGWNFLRFHGPRRTHLKKRIPSGRFNGGSAGRKNWKGRWWM